MRKFTIAQLEVRSLNRVDILWLSIYTILISLTLYLKAPNNKNYFAAELITVSFCTGMIILSPFGLRLRSVYFSSIWFLLSLLFTFNNLSIVWIPILDFLVYHVIRIIFWKKYDREFIPFTVGRGALYRYVSKIENRGGSIKDKNYMKLLIVLGVILNFICLLGLIGVKVK